MRGPGPAWRKKHGLPAARPDPLSFRLTGSKLAPPRMRAGAFSEFCVMLRAAILDDYQNVALELADWSPIKKDVELVVFNKPFASQAEAVKALQGFAIVVGMRERTPFPKAVIEALPDLKLLITTGMRNNSFDVAAANARGVTVCGTGAVGSPTTGIAFGLMLELTRRIGFENARLKSGQAWQVTLGRDLEGLTLGVLGLGKLGARSAAVGKAFGMKTDRLEPEPDAGEGERGRRRLRRARRTCSATPISSPSTWCCRSARAGWSAPRNSG